MAYDIPPAIVKHVQPSPASAKSHADKLAKEAASRAIETATRSKGNPKTSGR